MKAREGKLKEVKMIVYAMNTQWWHILICFGDLALCLCGNTHENRVSVRRKKKGDRHSIKTHFNQMKMTQMWNLIFLWFSSTFSIFPIFRTLNFGYNWFSAIQYVLTDTSDTVIHFCWFKRYANIISCAGETHRLQIKIFKKCLNHKNPF